MKKLLTLAGVALVATWAAAATQIDGAGATFPYPIYSK
jgi:ABC-type phosphate transport system substrate-binding protein